MNEKKSVGNTSFQKKANDALVLDMLRKRGPASRLELAGATGLRQSTLTYIIGRLIERGVVKEIDAAPPSVKRGQRPIPVAIDDSYGFVIGIDLCRASCSFAICDILGRVRCSEDFDGRGIEGFEDRFLACYRYAAAKAEKLGFRLLAVGLSVSGVVDSANGIIKRSWAEGLTGFDIAKRLSPKMRHPLVVENDAKCCAYARLWKEPDSSARASFIYLLLRQSPWRPGDRQLPLSVGMSIVVNGSVYRGASDFAGEFRSIFPPHEGKGQLSIPNEVLARFGSDEKVRREAMREILSNIAFLLIALNPNELYFGGDIPFDAAWLSSVIDQDLDLRGRYPQISACRILLSDEARLDAAFGACARVLSSIYSIPAIGSSPSSLDWDSLFASAEG
ncbi:MAG TPA: ROK family transcriptional regulator [Spirochaetales bacterium]|nr:ROK family transcriptional regulator [Spirochaetales bacterium]